VETDTEDVTRLPVLEEEMVVERRPVSRGNVRVHQGVETREQRLAVPVEHDEVTVERISADSFDAGAEEDPDVLVIPVMEEQLVVTKRQVVKEYVRIRKTRLTEQREVRDTVRRTVVEVEDQTDGAVR